MFFSPSFIFPTLALLVSGSIAYYPNQSWKLSHGWDGIVSSPTSIGTPLNKTAEKFTTRADETVGGIFICTAINWEGTCGYAVQHLSKCIVLGNDWNDVISSIGPDEGTLVIAYDSSDCTGTNIEFTYPGNSDLRTVGWNDMISSFEALNN